MKTNRSAWRIMKLRAFVLLLVFAAAIAMEWRLGGFLGKRLGHVTGVQTDTPPVCGVYFPN